MRHFLWLTLLISMASCTFSKGDLSLSHQVHVPDEYGAGRMTASDPSDQERYIHAYEQGWWSCTTNYAGDINYTSTSEDRAWNGWPAAVEGGLRGYEAAERHILTLKEKFGPTRTQTFLKDRVAAR